MRLAIRGRCAGAAGRAMPASVATWHTWLFFTSPWWEAIFSPTGNRRQKCGTEMTAPKRKMEGNPMRALYPADTGSKTKSMSPFHRGPSLFPRVISIVATPSARTRSPLNPWRIHLVGRRWPSWSPRLRNVSQYRMSVVLPESTRTRPIILFPSCRVRTRGPVSVLAQGFSSLWVKVIA